MRHVIVTELEGCLILGKRSGKVHHIAILTSNSLFLLSTCESAVDDVVSTGAWVEGGSPFQDDIVLHYTKRYSYCRVVFLVAGSI